MIDNSKALVPITPRKARPRYGCRGQELELPPFLAELERQAAAQRRSCRYSRWVLGIHRNNRRAAALEKLKIFVAGVAFVVFSLATAVVR